MSRGGRKRRKWVWLAIGAKPPWKVYYSPEEMTGEGWFKVRRPCQCGFDFALLVPGHGSTGLRLRCATCDALRDTGITVAVADEAAKATNL